MQPSLFLDDKPLKVTMALSGLRVLIEADTTQDDLSSALSRLGVEVSLLAGMVSIHIKDLPLLRALPLRSAVCDHLLTPLWRYTEAPASEEPAVLEELSGDLRLYWRSGGVVFDEVLDPQAVPALLASDLPFTASDQAWATLSRASSTPIVVATARMSPYGFYVLQSSKPQLLATAPLPGLFRISQTTFGVSSAYEKELLAAPGIRVTHSRTPSRTEIEDSYLANLSGSSHSTSLDVLECLSQRSGVVLVAPAGSSRRVATLAALAALDATPVLVVTPPWGVWAYQRAADFLHIRESVTAVTPRSLASMTAPPEFGSVVIDDPLSGQTAYNEAIARLDSIDTMKVAVCSSWPVSEQDQLFLLSRVRPQEFDDKTPIAVRYPLSPYERFTEHLQPFVRRAAHAPSFSSLSVEVVDPPQAMIDYLSSEKLPPLEVSRVVSAGSPSHVSPKFAAAVAHINNARAASRSVVVLSLHESVLFSISDLMSPLDRLPTDASKSRDGLSLALLDTKLPDLSKFQDIVLLEWPSSMIDLESSLPQPGDRSSKVTVIHMRNSIDDYLAQSSLAAASGSTFPAGPTVWPFVQQ